MTSKAIYLFFLLCEFCSGIEVNLGGSEHISYDLRSRRIAAENNHISFEFKTFQPSGLIIYSSGTQGDFVKIELVDGRLRWVQLWEDSLFYRSKDTVKTSECSVSLKPIIGIIFSATFFEIFFSSRQADSILFFTVSACKLAWQTLDILRNIPLWSFCIQKRNKKGLVQ